MGYPPSLIVPLPPPPTPYTHTHIHTLQILLKQGQIDVQEFDFLLRFPVEPTTVSPVSFLSAHTWGAIKVPSWPWHQQDEGVQ